MMVAHAFGESHEVEHELTSSMPVNVTIDHNSTRSPITPQQRLGMMLGIGLAIGLAAIMVITVVTVSVYAEFPGDSGECLRDMKCTVHDLEVMGLNPGRVKLGRHGTAVRFW